MQKFKNSRPALMVTTACLALACSKLIPEDKEKVAAPGTPSSPAPTKPTATVGDGKDTKSPPKTTTTVVPPANPSTIEPNFWIARAGDAGQTAFPPFTGAQQVDAMPSLCTDMAYAGGKVLYTVTGASFCSPGAEYEFTYDYEEPPKTGQKVRSVAVVSPWDMGLKAPSASAAPWILVDVVKGSTESGSTWIRATLRGTHPFANVPTSSAGGSSYAHGSYSFSKLDSDGSIPDDSDSNTFEDLLADTGSAGIGGLQVIPSTKGPAGTLEFKLGTKTLVLEPQWKSMEEILPAAAFAIPGDGTFVQAGVPTLTTPPMGTSEADLECPSMAFAPTVWDISGMRQFSYCYGVPSLSSSSLQAVPTAREHVSVRYDVAAKDGLSGYSVGLVADSCSASTGQVECSISIETDRTALIVSLSPGASFSYRGLTVSFEVSAGVLTSIKVRKPGATTDETFSARQFPL